MRSRAESRSITRTASFSHHGGDCTFETLLARFAIADKALRKISEQPECIWIDRILKSWAKRGMPDYEILVRGAGCFDGLYTFLRRL